MLNQACARRAICELPLAALMKSVLFREGGDRRRGRWFCAGGCALHPTPHRWTHLVSPEHRGPVTRRVRPRCSGSAVGMYYLTLSLTPVNSTLCPSGMKHVTRTATWPSSTAMRSSLVMGNVSTRHSGPVQPSSGRSSRIVR